MASTGQVGSRVSPDLIKQLEARQNAFKSNNKSRDQQIFINSNTAWVKLRSSVNVVKDEEFKNLDEATQNKEVSYKIKHDPAVAQSNVLMGGTRQTSDDSPFGTERAGVSRALNVIDRSKAYQNFTGENSLGFRPMPGITGMSIKAKGQYGQTMMAEVSLKVFSLEDLEAIELLYFRPGYTALLEWGHTLYLDNDSNLVQASTTGLTDKEWFVRSNDKDINEKINDKRASADGNYDGMYAYITNFSFDYQTDGSYDCTVKLLSKGVILEGLQPAKTSDHNNDSEDEKEDKPEEEKSIYHFLYKYLEEGAERGKSTLDKHLERNTEKTKDIKNRIKNSGHFVFSENDFKGTYSSTNDIPVYTTFMEIESDETYFGDKEFYLQFLHLGDWLRIFNSLNTIDDPRKSAEERAKNYMFDVSPGNKYTTHPDHFSCDPIVAYPTLKPAGKNGSDKQLTVTWSNPFKENEVLKNCIAFYDGPGKSNTDLHEDWSKHVKQNLDKYGGTDDVLSIPISFYTVVQEIDNLLNSSDDSLSMFDVLENLLDKVSDALGGIVDLDLFYNYDLERYQVIDRNNRIPKGLPFLNLTGTASTAKSIKVSSTISSNIATQISIAAQGNSGNSKDSLAVMMEWNRGAIDRHKPVKFSTTAKDDEEQIEKNKKFVKNLKKLYEEFQNRGIFKDHKYNPEIVSNIKTQAHTRNAELLNIHRLNQEKPLPPTGVVPVELSFDIIGIYGLVIGTAFKVNKGFLPSRYNNFAYLITGIENKIENNQWVTSVKTQFFPDRSANQVKAPVTGQSTTFISQQERESLAVGEIATDEQILNDPAPVINPGKIGSNYYKTAPLRNSVIAKGNLNGKLDITNPNQLIFIGEKEGADREYINPATGVPEYMLNPIAAAAWFRWRDEMRSNGISYSVSSAYRSRNHQARISGRSTAASAGSSPHGIGGALDFRNLYNLVGGSGNPNINLTKGRLTTSYKEIAEIGAKYNWYNPWRLSDVNGLDECWHFEYWGPV